jgi:predicted component of type VI protein secretion system
VHLLERWSLFLSKLFVICFLVAEFKKDEYTVGRDASCSLAINNSHLNKVEFNLVSKKQFKISHKKDGVYLEASAITYVNNKKISPAEKTILKHNDRIAIGELYLKGRYCCEVDVHKAQWIETSLAYLP